MAKLHFHYSVMNAGKSLSLLSIRQNWVENGGNIVLMTSAIDRRSGVGKIASRIGISEDAIALGEDDDLFEIIARLHTEKPVTAALLDEVQFMTSAHMWQAAKIVDDLGIPVMAFGLKNNVFGSLFGPAIEAILALADDIKEIKQLCWCGRKAGQILRYDPSGRTEKSGNVVEVGGDNRYVSVCRKHWMTDDIGPARRAQCDQRAA
ncbi:thymidine kinase [Bosea massiliensis]|jgi:thymidine kinase|uniref:Thymidine kinase n=1 Tax=Bosea massiliensis TaxID=151419 RepID=A0ABW0PAD3_9HYPH